MSTTPELRTIMAVPAGRDRHGDPLKAREFVIDREPEPFGEGRSRIFVENRSHRHPNGQFVFTPVVVVTDSIEQQPVVVHGVSSQAGLASIRGGLRLVWLDGTSAEFDPEIVLDEAEAVAR